MRERDLQLVKAMGWGCSILRKNGRVLSSGYSSPMKKWFLVINRVDILHLILVILQWTVTIWDIHYTCLLDDFYLAWQRYLAVGKGDHWAKMTVLPTILKNVKSIRSSKRYRSSL